MEKINKHIQRTLGEILQKEADIPADTLVTISRVDTTKNLQSSTVWLYISPSEKEDDVLRHLEGQLYDLQGSLNRIIAMRPLPRIRLKIDKGMANQEAITQALNELKHES